MSKDKDKSKPEPIQDEIVGKKGLSIMFDEPRFLRLDLLSMSWIEDNALGNIRAIPISAVMASLNRLGLLKTVLQGALGLDKHGNPITKAEDISGIFEGYIANTGDLADLQNTLQEVYEVATKNPTKLAAEREAKEKTKAKSEDPGGKK